MKDFLKSDFNPKSVIADAFDLDNTYLVDVDSNSNSLSISDSQGDIVSFNFDQTAYDAELDQIKKVAEYIVIGDDFLNILLADPFGHLKQLVSGNEIHVDGPYKGSISKDIFYALQFTNLKKLLSTNQWAGLPKNGNQIDLSTLLIDNVFVLEIKGLTSDVLDDIDHIDRIVNSILTHLAFKENIYLEIARDMFSIDQSVASSVGVIEFVESKHTEPLLYFLSGEKISHPHLKYLEYYHVIEYFFLDSSVKKIDSIIEELFTLKLSKPKSAVSDNYLNKITELYTLFGKNQKVNEEDQIKLVINELLGFKSIKSFIEGHKFDITKISSIIFNENETKLDLNGIFQAKVFRSDITPDNETKFCNEIAKRIYKIRNYIVHTKRGEKAALFTPTKSNFKALEADLIFIRLIAFRLIMATSL